MINFGSVIPEDQLAELVDAITCKARPDCRVTNFTQLMPLYRTATRDMVGAQYFYDSVSLSWKEVNNPYRNPPPPPNGYISQFLGSSINTLWENIVGKDNAYKPMSWYIFDSIVKNTVNPDIAPFYQGDLYNNITVAKLKAAEKKWAEAERQKLIVEFSVNLAEKALNEYEAEFLAAQKRGEDVVSASAKASFVANNKTQIDGNTDYASALENVGLDSSSLATTDEDKKEETPSLAGPIALSLVVALGTFGGIYWWSKRNG